MSITLDGTNGITTADVTADSYTGPLNVSSSAADDSVVVDASGNLGVGTTSPSGKVHASDGSSGATPSANGNQLVLESSGNAGLTVATGASSIGNIFFADSGDNADGFIQYDQSGRSLRFGTATAERARIDSSGVLMVGKTDTLGSTAGFIASPQNNGYAFITNDESTNSFYVLGLNRQNVDGTLVQFRQANTTEGTISVSGTTVSYNGGHLARFAQTVAAKDESLKKGTVLSNLDEMNSYTDAEGNAVDNEQLNKVKVSDVEGDSNVAGVFVNWAFDEAHNVDEINMAMTGDMIIRIAAGTTVTRGDLLMSAGDGTAKPQGDDIVRSKTIAKVTSTNVTCTYEDGSYCVPCVLMAC